MLCAHLSGFCLTLILMATWCPVPKKPISVRCCLIFSKDITSGSRNQRPLLGSLSGQFLHSLIVTWWESLTQLQKLKLPHKILGETAPSVQMPNVLSLRRCRHAKEMQSNIPEPHPNPSTASYSSVPVLNASREQLNEINKSAEWGNK